MTAAAASRPSAAHNATAPAERDVCAPCLLFTCRDCDEQQCACRAVQHVRAWLRAAR